MSYVLKIAIVLLCAYAGSALASAQFTKLPTAPSAMINVVR
jgi:hypothetical protein